MGKEGAVRGLSARVYRGEVGERSWRCKEGPDQKGSPVASRPCLIGGGTAVEVIEQ